jgi:hypothetical protein
MTSMDRLFLALAVSTAPLVATAQRTPLQSAVEPFDSVFRLVRRVPLVATPDEPVGAVSNLAVNGTMLFVVDGSNGNVKVFDIANGRLIRTIGRSGNGPGEMRRVTGIVVDPDGSVTTIDYSRQVLARRDPTGRLVDELRLLGQWSGLTPVGTGAARRLVLTGRAGITTREGGIPVEAAPTVLHEVDSTGIVRSSFPVEWPQSPWQRSFANFSSGAAGSTLATVGFATNVVRFIDVATGREWADTLRARWLKPIEWPKDDKFGAGSKMDQMREWVKQQALVSRVFVGSPRWYVAMVQLHDAAGEVLWGYIATTTDGRARIVTAPVTHKIQELRGETAYALTEDESGNYVLEVRRVRLKW